VHREVAGDAELLVVQRLDLRGRERDLGWLSASKKSGERRWASRCSSPVLIEATSTVPEAVAPDSEMSSLPSNVPKLPRTVAMPMCLTWNSTRECAGSTVQVPVGTAVTVVLMVCLP